jgi:oligoribonuclease NrnB/cAMP/cGMP phosphodiesterase (DHH superfamily)
MVFDSMEETLTIIDSTKKAKMAKIDPSGISYNESLSELLKKSREIYCTSNQGNFDGMGTPALLIRNYGINPDNAFFILPKGFKSFLEHIKKLKPSNSTIIIADLALNKDQIPYVKEAFSLLEASNNSIIWLDHHPWDAESLNAVKGIRFGVFGECKRYCATELAYLLLCKREKGNQLLADMVHVADFALKSKRFGRPNEKISRTIIYYLLGRPNPNRNLQKLCGILAGLDFNNKFISNAYKAYLKNSMKSIKVLKENIRVVATSPYRIAVGFSKRLQINQACEIIMQKTKSDIDVYVDIETGKSGMRSRKGVDCSVLARALNGGGHPQASGFDADPKKLSKNGKEKFLANLQSLLRTKRIYT